MPNLTPSEIAIIRLKAELGKAPVEYNFNESVAYEIGYTEGYTIAACEYAAEIKRLTAEVAELKLFIKTNLQ